MSAFNLTEWQQYKNHRAMVEHDSAADPRNDWQWDVEGVWGYDGVHTFENQVVWYSHAHNPHESGAAFTQSFEDFLENGPHFRPPEDMMLDELYDAVRILSQME